MIPFYFRVPVSAAIDDESILIPAGIKTKTELFRALKVALRLPDYFGHNWDALEECLHDAAWLDENKIIVIHEDLPPVDSVSDQTIYLQILAEAARELPRFEIIFPERDRVRVEHLLSDAPADQ